MGEQVPSDKWQGGGLAEGASFGQYKILQKIGVGGMGEVYLATDTKLERSVALKFLPESLRADPEARQRLLREAKAASKLNHKNILTVHAVEEIDSHDFIVMEHIDGQSLDELIADGNLTNEQIIRIGLHVADGLVTAHEAGVIHRDIKPSNIIITRQGQAKIMDFGLATWRGATQLTRDGSTMGTIAYSSPEQAQGRDIDHRSDLFSLGTVLYQMIAGRLPFGGEHEAAIIYSIVNEDPEPLARFKSDVHPGLQEVVSKALEKDPGMRYQSAAGLLADLKREKRALDPSYTSAPHHTPQPITKPGRRLLSPAVISTSAIVVIALMLLLLKPWKLEIVPDQPAAAAVEDRLAVMYFENIAEADDPRRLGEIAANLLITDMSESHFIQVVSSQRLYDILKLLDMEGVKVIDKGVATQVAQKADARWMLTGSILQVEPQIVLTTQLVEVATGNAIASQQITGEPGKTIFDLIDRLTVEIKSDLSLPQEALGERDPEVANITTGSWDAYRDYLEGMEYFYKYMWPQSEASFRAAIAIDSTFAMAYYGLSLVRSLDGPTWLAAIGQAVRYIDRASHKEQEFILAQSAFLHRDYDEAVRRLERIIKQYPDEKEAYFRLARVWQQFSNREKTLWALHKAIEVDSLFKDAYNVLAYGAQSVGDWETALWAVNKYIDLAPDEPNVYDTQGDLYSYHGDIDAAIASYKKALEVDSNYTTSLVNLGARYVTTGNYIAAQRVCDRLIAHPDKDARAEGRWVLAQIPIRQGLFQQALRALEFGLEADRVENCAPFNLTHKLMSRAIVYEQAGNYNAAIADAETCVVVMERQDPFNPIIHVARGYVPYLYAVAGDTAKADSLAAVLQSRFETGDSTWPNSYWDARGYYDLARQQYDAATEAFDRSVKLFGYSVVWCGLAESHYKAGRLADAVRAYEQALRVYGPSRIGMGPKDVLTHYRLGVAYGESGWNDQAVAQYEQFLDIWKDADPGIAEIDDAKARLARLKNASS